jgi:magnesium chelatase accessory protein
MKWSIEGTNWPHRERSEFVKTAHLTWHVQRWLDMPSSAKKTTVVLLHGTGASTHSWRDVAPLLAKHFNVFAIDLPGHAFSEHPDKAWMSLDGMANAIAELLATLQISADVIVGHSAGAAIAVNMALLGLAKPKKIVAINGALLPLQSFSGHLFLPLAKLLAANPLVPKFFSWRASANTSVVNSLLDRTGSSLDQNGKSFYNTLVRSADHAAGALAMMANWDLDCFEKKLPLLKSPLLLIVGSRDKTINPEQANRVRHVITQAELATIPGLGHLCHEESPQLAADLIIQSIQAPARKRQPTLTARNLPAVSQ